MDRSELGSKVRAGRSAKGLTQFGLAKAVECDPSTIARIEQGKVDVSADLIARIALVLAVTTDSLLLDPPDVSEAASPS